MSLASNLTRASAARQLARETTARRAHLRADDPDRVFLLGVEAACKDVVHPELTFSRPETWLDHEPPRFRDGYLTTKNLIATSDPATGRLPMPEPR